ncbi:MAG TPA: DUF4190 domain-containing protein [Terriglobales bacterium]|nr:DUF4190 domain-containing protein [Terriglobales bacterium]
MTDSKAVTSLVLGILSFFCFSILTGIPAIIVGHMSRSTIRKSMGRVKGDGMALAGLVLGYLSVALVVPVLIIAAIAIPNLIRERIAANEASARYTMTTLATAESNYQASNPNMGYAADIAALGPDAGTLAGLNCTGNSWCTKSGYRFMLQADQEQPHQQYVITAIPVQPNRTGRRSFCSTADGVLRSEGAAAYRTTPYTAEECTALTPWD